MSERKVFEPVLLPVAEKERLCRELLDEFGLPVHTHYAVRHELVIPCRLGRHANQDHDPTAALNYKKLTFKCLSADTVVKTYEGERRIGDLAGQTARLLDGNGKWVDAPVRYYGKDRLYRVTLSRNGVKREVYATADHRWYVREAGAYAKGKRSALHEESTLTLRPKQRVPSVWPMVRTGRTRKYERTHWWVTSVEETDRFEDVYCAEVTTTNSFVLADNLLTGNCLGCKRSGGLLWFIAEHRGTPATDARKWLAQETGTDGEAMDLSALLRYFDALYGGTGSGREPMTTYAEETLAPWALLHPWVTDPIQHDAQGRSIGGRGIPEESALRFRVGYAENYFMGTGMPTSERIVIPHFWQGALVGWQARRLCADGSPKYKASTSFPRDTTVFNYDPDADWALVVEAPLSTVAHDAGDLHLESTFGANVTEHQARLLARHKRVVFWFDNDHPGWEAYTGLVDWRGRQTKVGLLEQVGSMTDVWVVQNDLHADPADLTHDDVQRLVDRQSVPWVLWKMPSALRCYRCGQQAHEGGCAP